MAAVFRKSYTVELPSNAKVAEKRRTPTPKELAANPAVGEMVELVAVWKDANGKTRKGRVSTTDDGKRRVLLEAETFVAKYRDGAGIVREVPTGCRTKDGALSVLRGLTNQVEKVRAGILTPTEATIADQQNRLLASHFADYLTHLRANDNSCRYISETERLAKRLCDDCGFTHLNDINLSNLEKWLDARKSERMAARTRNSYLQALAGFCQWCVANGRLLVNPLARTKRADEGADRRRQRRAMTETELGKLLYVARWRPLAEHGRQSVKRDDDAAEGTGKRANWTYAPLTFDDLDDAVQRARKQFDDKPAFVAGLEQRGRERALIYKTLVLTGLRKGELASITVGQLRLDTEPAFVELAAADEKNR